MVIKLFKRKNIIKEILFSKKYKPKIVKPKKGKGSFIRKKNNLVLVVFILTYFTSTLKLITIRSSFDSFFETLWGR